MNIKNFKALRAFISKLPANACNMNVVLRVPLKSNDGDPYTRLLTYASIKKMQKAGFACGTTGCFKGWSNVIESIEDKKNINLCNAGRWLGLNVNQEENLFYTSPGPKWLWKTWMLRRLDTIIRTKRVRASRGGAWYLRH